MLAKLLAGILGLMSFFLCMAGGWLAGTRAEVAIGRGLKAMLVFCVLGWLIGWAAESVIYEHVRKEALDKADRESDGQQDAKTGEPGATPAAPPTQVRS